MSARESMNDSRKAFDVPVSGAGLGPAEVFTAPLCIIAIGTLSTPQVPTFDASDSIAGRCYQSIDIRTDCGVGIAERWNDAPHTYLGEFSRASRVEKVA